MSSQMYEWKWTCSACNAEFGGDTKTEAEGKFLTHAREVHNPEILLSFDTTETYSVFGGQGHRILASDLSRGAAHEFAKQFDIKCANAGLTNPPTMIKKEAHK